MSIVIDLLLVAIVILIVLFAAKKGFVRSVLSLLGTIVAIVVSYFLAKCLAGMIFDSMVRPWLTDMVHTQVLEAGVQDIQSAVAGLYASLPSMFSGMLNMIFGSQEELVSQLQSSMNGDIAATLSNLLADAMAPFVTMLIGSLLFILFFILCGIVLRIIDKVLISVRHLPVVGSLDGVLGGALGIVQALIVVVLCALAVRVLISLSSNEWTWLNTQVVDSTYLFKYFYHFSFIDVLLPMAV